MEQLAENQGKEQDIVAKRRIPAFPGEKEKMAEIHRPDSPLSTDDIALNFSGLGTLIFLSFALRYHYIMFSSIIYKRKHISLLLYSINCHHHFFTSRDLHHFNMIDRIFIPVVRFK